jgi:integrase
LKNRVRTEKRLKAKDLDTLPVGTHEDGGGLRFIVEQGSRRWAQRFTLNGKRLVRGLGSYPLVTLEAAREEALEIRRAARKGQDLIAERKRPTAMTFRQAAEAYWSARAPSLSNAKHIAQWLASMEAHVYPRIGERPVSAVARAEIIEVLKPIWTRVPPTARRVLTRINSVFAWAIAHDHRERANPCTCVAEELGGKRPDVRHHPALPYAEVRDFIRELRTCSSRPMTRLAFEFLVLTVMRSETVRAARWDEIDEAKAQWVIPRERSTRGKRSGSGLKGLREHVVPLAPRCLEILHEARNVDPHSELLFPTDRSGGPLSDMAFSQILRTLGLADRATAHGFRSSFKDWCAEVERVRDEVSEAALAHAVKGQVRAAYLRTKFLPERIELMERWAAFCAYDSR